MVYKLNIREEKELNKIKSAYYMQPTLSRIDSFIREESEVKMSWRLAFNSLNSIITDAYKEVDAILEAKLQKKEIKDKKQANKTVVGNTFPYAVIYIFLQNKICGNIQENIFITSELSKISGFKDIAIIKVGGETQKPDCDLVVYSVKEDKNLDKCIIFSLKTSLRERAAQTYKWKLLMEIAISDATSIKEKYDISYEAKNLPLICFATINFYNEINNPQQRGILNFFDKAFLAKNFQEKLPEFITPMSQIIDFVNNHLG